MKKINVVLVGLGFGGAFAEIYRYHPNVGTVGIFDTNTELLKKVSDWSGIQKTYGCALRLQN